MRHLVVLFVVILIVLTSCKSEFEALRNSNQPEKVYKAANKFYDEKEYDKAIALYDVVIQYYRGKTEAEDLFLKYAYAHYYMKDYILASTYFKNYSTTFSNSVNKEDAEFMAAFSNFKLSPNYKLDQSYTTKAIEGLEQFINQNPTSIRVAEANSLIDQMRRKLEVKAFEQGSLYYKISQFQAAVASFQIMLKDFPESKKTEEVRFLIFKSSFTLAKNSIYEKQKERYEESLAHYERFLKKHPDSKLKKEAKSIEKEILQEIKKLKA